ncbi:MAG: TDT family transporter [Spirochaetes bacterium]|nr:TDT family transporter [Spirochaetota bacterium]
METIIRRIPIPIAGLMLALAASGNIVSKFGPVYRNIFGAMALVILVLLAVKFLFDNESIRKELQNPVIASVLPTITMAIMLLSTYLSKSYPYIAYEIWHLGLIAHILYIIYYSKKFIINFEIKNIFPSTFIVFVGIVVGSVTSPVYNLYLTGQILFWFGFIAYLVLLPIIFYRLLIFKNIPEAATPLVVICAAPANLCLFGYLNAFQEKNISIIIFLAILGSVMTFFVLMYMPRLLKLKFYPSYAAFSFPFVISAVALKKVNEYFSSVGINIEALAKAVVIEEIIALIIVGYVCIRYANYLLPRKEAGVGSV